MGDKVPESFGNSFLGTIVAIALLILLFKGSPDVADSIRVWAGKTAGTLPADYVWIQEQDDGQD